MSIWRLGYVEVRSLDLERDRQFWRDVVGLVETDRGDGKAYFKCWDEQDHLVMNDVEIEIGPTRHAITRGFTVYFFDPSGNRFEFFMDGARPDPDDEPITWTADQIGRSVFLYEKNLPEAFMTRCS